MTAAQTMACHRSCSEASGLSFVAICVEHDSITRERPYHGIDVDIGPVRSPGLPQQWFHVLASGSAYSGDTARMISSPCPEHAPVPVRTTGLSASHDESKIANFALKDGLV